MDFAAYFATLAARRGRKATGLIQTAEPPPYEETRCAGRDLNQDDFHNPAFLLVRSRSFEFFVLNLLTASVLHIILTKNKTSPFPDLMFKVNKKTMKTFLKSTLAVATLTLASTSAFAAGAVGVETNNDWNGTGMMQNHLMGVGGTITASGITESVNGYADNAMLGNASWGHAGAWYTFMTHNALDTTITVSADNAGDMSPGFTLWRTDGEFDGGTGGTGEAPNVLSGPQQTPHSFNQLGAAGENGTIWMTDDSLGGNTANGLLETMGYVNSGDASGATAWNNNDGSGNTAVLGAGGIFSGTGAFSSVAGSSATMDLDNLAAGWYAIYISGADGGLTGSPMGLSVSQVPVPAAVYLFGTALVGLFASGRRKLAA